MGLWGRIAARRFTAQRTKQIFAGRHAVQIGVALHNAGIGHLGRHASDANDADGRFLTTYLFLRVGVAHDRTLSHELIAFADLNRRAALSHHQLTVDKADGRHRINLMSHAGADVLTGRLGRRVEGTLARDLLLNNVAHHDLARGCFNQAPLERKLARRHISDLIRERHLPSFRAHDVVGQDAGENVVGCERLSESGAFLNGHVRTHESIELIETQIFKILVKHGKVARAGQIAHDRMVELSGELLRIGSVDQIIRSLERHDGDSQAVVLLALFKEVDVDGQLGLDLAVRSGLNGDHLIAADIASRGRIDRLGRSLAGRRNFKPLVANDDFVGGIGLCGGSGCIDGQAVDLADGLDERSIDGLFSSRSQAFAFNSLHAYAGGNRSAREKKAAGGSQCLFHHFDLPMLFDGTAKNEALADRVGLALREFKNRHLGIDANDLGNADFHFGRTQVFTRLRVDQIFARFIDNEGFALLHAGVVASVDPKALALGLNDRDREDRVGKLVGKIAGRAFKGLIQNHAGGASDAIADARAARRGGLDWEGADDGALRGVQNLNAHGNACVVAHLVLAFEVGNLGGGAAEVEGFNRDLDDGLGIGELSFRSGVGGRQTGLGEFLFLADFGKRIGAARQELELATVSNGVFNVRNETGFENALSVLSRDAVTDGEIGNGDAIFGNSFRQSGAGHEQAGCGDCDRFKCEWCSHDVSLVRADQAKNC